MIYMYIFVSISVYSVLYDIYKCQDLMFPFTDTLVAYLQYIIYIYSRFIYILDTGQFIVHI